MSNPSVTATGIQKYMEALGYVWVEYTDAVVAEVAQEAIAALANLHSIVSEYQ